MDAKLLTHEYRDHFIEENKNFIYSTCYKVCKRHLNWQNDDELSIGLIAFNHACENYIENKGDFHSYAKVIIRNALIDYFRKAKNVPYLTFDQEEDTLEFIDYKISINHFQVELENTQRAEEIASFSKMLANYKLDFSSLVDSSPSHKDTRETLLNIAFVCAREPSILKHINEKKQLPIKEMMLLTKANRKLLEKWRRYILVLILLLSNDEYLYIRSYLNIKVGEKNE